MKRSLKDLSVLGIFTVGYTGLSGIISLGNRNWEFVYYCATVLVFICVVCAVYLRRGLSRPVLWALSVWGLLHMCGGLVSVPQSWPINGETRVLYSLWLIPGLLKYDHVIHAYGFCTCVFVCFEALSADIRNFYSTSALVTAALAAMGLGAINELLEFIAVLVIPNTNVGGYENTGWDLVSNAAGVTVGAALAARIYPKSKPKRSMLVRWKLRSR